MPGRPNGYPGRRVGSRALIPGPTAGSDLKNLRVVRALSAAAGRGLRGQDIGPESPSKGEGFLESM